MLQTTDKIKPGTGPHQVTLDQWISCAPFETLLGIEIIEAHDSRFGTISLNAEFLVPVTKGVLAARAEVKLLEDRLVQGNAMVSDEKDRPVMRFSAMFKLGREVIVSRHRTGE